MRRRSPLPRLEPRREIVERDAQSRSDLGERAEAARLRRVSISLRRTIGKGRPPPSQGQALDRARSCNYDFVVTLRCGFALGLGRGEEPQQSA